MKFVSWNVNGIRAVLKKGFIGSLKKIDPDVLCLQETRALPDQVDISLEGYHFFWNPARKKGYSGTAVFSRIKPVSVTSGISKAEHDNEGRVITLEFEDYFLVNVYTPNSQEMLARLDYRTQKWDKAFLEYLKKLDKKKPVIFCGDLNVAHKPIDLSRPQENERNAGFTIEERDSFDRILSVGFIDTFRQFCKEGGHYTWWSYFSRAREKNLGWRIDYFCISRKLLPRLKNSTILPEVLGSDHCPIVMELN